MDWLNQVCCDRFSRLKLIVVHSHYRPGGVRRVIELATPHLARLLRPPVSEIVLAGAGTPEEGWRAHFAALVRPVPVRYAVAPALGYVSEQKRTGTQELDAQLRSFLSGLLDGIPAGGCVVWAHNPGLGRNLLLSRALEQACAAREIPLVLHHHDLWFDNRWQRWNEMRAHGFASLAQVAAAIFPASPNVRHIAINQADAAVLQRHFPHQSGWLPNPASGSGVPGPKGTREARRWLREQLGDDAPVWLMPCRLLRRKNIGEALLLTRWLRPEAWLVTTAGVTSPEEQPYSERLQEAAARFQWPLRMGVLSRAGQKTPSVVDLMGASEAILLTSLQEGFGLPYIEAAVARRALIARNLPNIAPDLAAWGLRFPQAYDELLVHPNLFDWHSEQARQRKLFDAWRRALPRAVRPRAEEPVLLKLDERKAGAVPFSRLTLTAQLEVLKHPAPISSAACAPLNPWLHAWRDAAAKGGLGLTAWPPRAARRLSGETFSKGFSTILADAPDAPLSTQASVEAQREFIDEKLRTKNLYPLTWSPET